MPYYGPGGGAGGGNLLDVFEGDFDAAKGYDAGKVVTYDGETWIAKNPIIAGTVPGSGGAATLGEMEPAPDQTSSFGGPIAQQFQVSEDVEVGALAVWTGNQSMTGFVARITNDDDTETFMSNTAMDLEFSSGQVHRFVVPLAAPVTLVAGVMYRLRMPAGMGAFAGPLPSISGVISYMGHRKADNSSNPDTDLHPRFELLSYSAPTWVKLLARSEV